MERQKGSSNPTNRKGEKIEIPKQINLLDDINQEPQFINYNEDQFKEYNFEEKRKEQDRLEERRQKEKKYGIPFGRKKQPNRYYQIEDQQDFINQTDIENLQIRESQVEQQPLQISNNSQQIQFQLSDSSSSTPKFNDPSSKNSKDCSKSSQQNLLDSSSSGKNSPSNHFTKSPSRQVLHSQSEAQVRHSHEDHEVKYSTPPTQIRSQLEKKQYNQFNNQNPNLLSQQSPELNQLNQTMNTNEDTPENLSQEERKQSKSKKKKNKLNRFQEVEKSGRYRYSNLTFRRRQQILHQENAQQEEVQTQQQEENLLQYQKDEESFMRQYEEQLKINNQEQLKIYQEEQLIRDHEQQIRRDYEEQMRRKYEEQLRRNHEEQIRRNHEEQLQNKQKQLRNKPENFSEKKKNKQSSPNKHSLSKQKLSAKRQNKRQNEVNNEEYGSSILDQFKIQKSSTNNPVINSNTLCYQKQTIFSTPNPDQPNQLKSRPQPPWLEDPVYRSSHQLTDYLKMLQQISISDKQRYLDYQSQHRRLMLIQCDLRDMEQQERMMEIYSLQQRKKKQQEKKKITQNNKKKLEEQERKKLDYQRMSPQQKQEYNRYQQLKKQQQRKRQNKAQFSRKQKIQQEKAKQQIKYSNQNLKKPKKSQRIKQIYFMHKTQEKCPYGKENIPPNIQSVNISSGRSSQWQSQYQQNRNQNQQSLKNDSNKQKKSSSQITKSHKQKDKVSNFNDRIQQKKLYPFPPKPNKQKPKNKQNKKQIKSLASKSLNASRIQVENMSKSINKSKQRPKSIVKSLHSVKKNDQIVRQNKTSRMRTRRVRLQLVGQKSKKKAEQQYSDVENMSMQQSSLKALQFKISLKKMNKLSLLIRNTQLKSQLDKYTAQLRQQMGYIRRSIVIKQYEKKNMAKSLRECKAHYKKSKKPTNKVLNILNKHYTRVSQNNQTDKKQLLQNLYNQIEFQCLQNSQHFNNTTSQQNIEQQESQRSSYQSLLRQYGNQIFCYSDNPYRAKLIQKQQKRKYQTGSQREQNIQNHQSLSRNQNIPSIINHNQFSNQIYSQDEQKLFTANQVGMIFKTFTSVLKLYSIKNKVPQIQNLSFVQTLSKQCPRQLLQKINSFNSLQMKLNNLQRHTTGLIERLVCLNRMQMKLQEEQQKKQRLKELQMGQFYTNHDPCKMLLISLQNKYQLYRRLILPDNRQQSIENIKQCLTYFFLSYFMICAQKYNYSVSQRIKKLQTVFYQTIIYFQQRNYPLNDQFLAGFEQLFIKTKNIQCWAGQ